MPVALACCGGCCDNCGVTGSSNYPNSNAINTVSSPNQLDSSYDPGVYNVQNDGSVKWGFVHGGGGDGGGGGGSCSPGDTAPCTDNYGCSGTQTCQSDGTTWGACVAQEYTVPACQGTVTSCSSLNLQISCQSQQGCSWTPSYSCTGTSTSCDSLPANCINSQGYAQQGCSTGTQVNCGTTTTTTTTTSSTTTTTAITCNNNGVCDNLGSGYENQATCPNDCKTTVTISPNVNVQPNESVTVTISFYDWRYSPAHNVSYSLTIDGITWNSSNGCPLGDGTQVTPDISQNGYASITRICAAPSSITTGTHVLTAVPTIYSNTITLRAVQTQFTAVGQDSLTSAINSLIATIKSFLGMK